MKKIVCAVMMLLVPGLAIAQTSYEVEGAFIACEGIRRACPRTPDLADCTKARIDNCQAIEKAWNKIQTDRKVEHQSKSIDGIAEQLKQKTKP